MNVANDSAKVPNSRVLPCKGTWAGGGAVTLIAMAYIYCTARAGLAFGIGGWPKWVAMMACT
ncbi:hypothetical protein GCM10027395_07700 [Giesbergeria sinuosa]